MIVDAPATLGVLAVLSWVSWRRYGRDFALLFALSLAVIFRVWHVCWLEVALLWGGLVVAYRVVGRVEHMTSKKKKAAEVDDDDEEEMTLNTGSDPHMDLGSTFLKAYNKLDPAQISSMKDDTKELMETQKQLMETLKGMGPAVTQGVDLINTFKTYFGKAGIPPPGVPAAQ